jgi:hypothetical protein
VETLSALANARNSLPVPKLGQFIHSQPLVATNREELKKTRHSRSSFSYVSEDYSREREEEEAREQQRPLLSKNELVSGPSLGNLSIDKRVDGSEREDDEYNFLMNGGIPSGPVSSGIYTLNRVSDPCLGR